MKTELIQNLTATFEGHAQQTESCTEYWLARDLQHLLGYGEWRNFNNTAISKAKTACEVSGHRVSDHFVGVNKMVDLGSGSQRECEFVICEMLNAQARELEQTIARNVAGIMEA